MITRHAAPWCARLFRWGLAIAAVLLVSGGCANRQPAPAEFDRTYSGATSITDAIFNMQKLFGALTSHVDQPGKPLLSFANDLAGDTRTKASAHEKDLQTLRKRYDEMTRWGLDQEKRANAAEQTWGYWAEYQLRFYGRWFRNSLILAAVLGLVGKMIGGLTGSIISWPARYLITFVQAAIGLKTGLRPRAAT